MPGIVGFVSHSNKKKNQEIVEGMVKRMKYHEWFETDTYSDDFIGIGTVGFGERYGSKISDKNPSKILIMDGEIYSVRKSPTNQREPNNLLNFFLKREDTFVKELDGAFVIVVWEREKRRLTVYNDRYGLRPLYYAATKESFLFSSEMKGMLGLPTFKIEIDERALYEFLSFGYVLGNRTFSKDVSLLPPGSILIYQDGEVQVKKYWDFIFTEEYDESIRIERYVERMYEILKVAVKERIVDEELTVGSFLSGGLDTRTITALIPKDRRPLHTFTHNTGQPNDVEIAAVLAKRLGLENHFLPLESDYMQKYARELVWVNEGASDVTCAHLFSILDKIREKVDVILDGTSGDMFLGSFVRPEFFEGNGKGTDKFVFSLVNYPFQEQEIRMLLGDFSNTYSAYDCFDDVFKEIPFSHVANRFDYFIIQHKLRRWLFSGLVNIRSRLEVRSPFYDNDFIDFYLTVPPKLRLDQRLYRQFHLRCFPEIANIPQGNGEMVRTRFTGKTRVVLNRKIKKKIGKKGLNFAEMLRNESRELITSILLDKRTVDRGYYNEEYLKRLVNEHMTKRNNHATKLAYLVTFELWNRMFVDGESL
jgi:asparagine synthase (glutamine-hydrolysing)